MAPTPGYRPWAQAHQDAAGREPSPQPLPGESADRQPDDRHGLGQTLTVLLQPEIRAALQAPSSGWFDAAERVARLERLPPRAVAALFDERLLTALGHSRHDPWFAYAWSCLSEKRTEPTAPSIAPATVSSTMESVWERPQAIAPADGLNASGADPAPTVTPAEALPAFPEPPDEITAPPERMLRLLPEVTQSVTARAASVEALATAVFTHLTGRAA